MNDDVAAGPRDEAERCMLSSLLQESLLWLAIVRRELPPGWTERTMCRHEQMLAHLRDIFADRSVDAHTRRAAEAWLTGYCTTMRKQHAGASASDVLRRSRGGAPADGAQQCADIDAHSLARV